MKVERDKRVKLWIKRLFLIGVCGLLALTVINIYIKQSTKDRIISQEEALNLEADCVMILGAGVFNNQVPSLMLEDRLEKGIGLYQDGAVNSILMSGDHGRVDYDEVNVMKAYALEKAIPSEDVFMDHAGFSTYESMYRARDIFLVKKMIIVTQTYHMPRAIFIAKALGIDAYGVPAEDINYRAQFKRDIREWLARGKDFMQTIFKPEPTFLGETIPISGDGDLTND